MPRIHEFVVINFVKNVYIRQHKIREFVAKKQ